MKKYGLHGKLTATAKNRQQLVSILLEASKLVSTASGCRLYLVSEDQKNNDSIWVTEVWDTKEDHDNALKQENVRALITKAMPLIAGQPEGGQVFTVLGGAGID